MAELKNTFSWSFSAASDFEECRRKRYWGKYAMWGGWSKNASPLQRTAYRLNKMDNRYSLMGRATEDAVMWALRKAQAGGAPTVEEAYEAAARPMLNRAWKESKSGQWEQDPKRVCCLWEHYYGGAKGESKEWVEPVIEQTRTCIGNFLDRVLPRLAEVRPEQEVHIASPESGGEPECFEFEGIKIYAIPDYVYRLGDVWHIHDWKAGKAKPEHKDQLALYGLWAHTKHGIEAGKIMVFLEYLRDGVMAYEQVTEDMLEAARESVKMSVTDMADFLVDEDIQRNQALPKEDWDLALEPRSCRMCKFYELCEPELGQGKPQ